VKSAPLLLVALFTAISPAPVPAQDEGIDPATPRWDQFGGNAARTFASGVEPVRSAPRVAWKGRFPGSSSRNMVAWEGTLYMGGTSPSGNGVLRALSLADGRVLATKDLGKPGSWLAVADGMVVVADDSGLRAFQLQGNAFSLRWTVRGKHPFPPAVLDDVVWSVSGGFLSGYAAPSGKLVADPVEFPTECPPVLAKEGGRVLKAGVTTGPLKGYRGTYVFLQVDGRPSSRDFGQFRDPATSEPRLHLCRLAPEGEDGGGWLLHSSSPLAGSEEDCPSSILPQVRGRGDGGLAPIASPATTYRGSAIGFGNDGTLVAVRAGGLFMLLVDRKGLPRGTRPGPASRARSTAYFGNWALDLDTRRVLWSLPDLHPEGPLVPVADRILIAVTESGEVSCLTDRPEAGSAPSPGTAAADAPAAAGLPPPPPLTGDGLLLADGSSVEGPVEALAGGRFRVAPAGGTPHEEDGTGLLLARGDGRVLFRGRESALLARWRRTLHPGAVEVLMGIHGSMAKSGLHEAAAATLADAAYFGLPADRAAEATRRAGSVKANGFPAKILGELEPGFRKARSAAREGILAASDWCRDRGFPAAAACLLLDAGRMLPGDGVVDARVAATVPDAFPWKGEADGGRRWLEWAPEIVAADGAFLPASHPLRAAITAGPWAVGEPVLVLRTPNVVFRSRYPDAAAVGRCLRNAEFVCRALALLLGPGEVAPVRGDDGLMDIRLHADEKSFRAEDEADGSALAWSAGYYAPDEGVSRFFVPGGDSRDPLGRGLFEVLAHELTHHFLDTRWKATRDAPKGGPRAPGYWAIEGIARFVEDQAVEMDRRGLRFDDRTAPSLEAAAQAAGLKVLFRPSRLLSISHAEFATLSDKELLRVRLRNTLEGRILSAIGLFYEQAGATAYFLVMERGEEGRKAFFAYLADVYAGRAPAEGWKPLGFASAEAFDAAIAKFLEGLR